jgi:serine/threonine-protein kinase RsbW
MNAVPLYSFPALMESLEPALEHFKAAAQDTEPALALRAETALEELLTNSVLHGNAEQSVAARIWLGVVASAQTLGLCFEDAFAEFDPLAEIEAALQRTASPIEERRAGGLGLLMVYRLADEFRYVRENGRNRIELSFRRRNVA